jgi:hypothetical protein
MTERREDKSSDCGRGISDLEKLTWNGFSMDSKSKTHSLIKAGHVFLGTMAN